MPVYFVLFMVSSTEEAPATILLVERSCRSDGGKWESGNNLNQL
jgi:hypothetical protein